MELEQPSGDSAVVDETTPATTQGGDATEIQFDEATGLPLAQQQPDEAELEEEVDGVKLRGTKEALERAKAERLMHKDYTQKTQATAEERRALAADREAFHQAQHAHQAHLREVAQVVAIDDRLAQFQGVNWSTLTDQDPVQALKLHTEFTQLQATKAQLVGALTQRQQHAQVQQQRETAKQLMQAQQVLERDIKGWSPELAGKLMEFGIAQGFAPEAMSSITNPAIVKLLHKAYIADQVEKQRTAKAPAAPAPPATRLSGTGAVSTKDPAQMSDREFAAWRHRQIAQRRP